MTMRKVSALGLLLFLASGVQVSQLPAAEPVRVAILPFEVHSSEDLGFLQKGILDMLSSRVPRGGGVEVVDRASVMALKKDYASGFDASRAAALGRKLGADFMVFGSISKLGTHVSLDGEVVDVGDQANTTRLSAEAAEMDGVIPQVGRLAQEIRRAALGQTRGSLTSASNQPPPSQTGPHQQEVVPGGGGPAYPVPPGGYPVPPGGFTGRGDDLFTRSDEPLIYNRDGETLNPAFIMSYQADQARRGYIKSPELEISLIQAVDVGDADGDGRPETVVADEDRIYIYKNILMDTSQPTVINPAAVRGKIVALDVADVNRNGVAEIYITTVELRDEMLSSQVVEYRNGKYQTIAERLPYFLRVTRSLQEGLVLLGQEKRARVFSDRHSEFLNAPFEKPFRLEWQGTTLVKGKELPLQEDVCVLGITMVDVDRDGADEYLAFDRRDYLKLFNVMGGLVWASREPYGRTSNYFLKDLGRELTPWEEPIDEKVWLPARTATVDIDNDGWEEIILCHNYEPIKLLSQSRIFTKSALFSLSWDGMDFMENWRTREMKGYVADYQVKDVDDDGKPELLVALVYKRGGLNIIKSKASILAFELRLGRAKQAAQKGGSQEGNRSIRTEKKL